MSASAANPVLGIDSVVGQIGRAVGMYLITTQYPDSPEQEDVIKRLMMGEKIAVSVVNKTAYVYRDKEFDTWYLRRS